MDKLPIIFVATNPDKINNKLENPPILNLLFDREDLVVIHQGFSYDSEVGKKALDHLKDDKIPESNHLWHSIVEKDIFAIKQCDALIYDMDKDPGAAYLMAGVIFGKPIIGVSNEMAAAPLYFSGHMQVVVRPENLIDFLEYKKIIGIPVDRKVDMPSPTTELETELYKKAVTEAEKSTTFSDTKSKIEKVIQKGLETAVKKQATIGKETVTNG